MLLLGFVLFSGETALARAETYYLGDESVRITLHFGDVANYPLRQMNGGEKYYKIASYNASSSKGGAASSLLDGEGRVIAPPAVYYMAAETNAWATDSSGNKLEGVTCSGIIRITVEKKDLPICFEEESLQVTYGDPLSPLDWDFVKEADRDESLEIAFSTEEDYSVSVLSVTKGGEDYSDYYNVQLSVKNSTAEPRISVLPRAIAFEYAEVALVPFNTYLLADGESVYSLSQSGVNGETVTCYFRIKGAHPALLTLGEYYEVEFYRYEVAPAEGEAVSYSAEELSDYAPSVLMTATAVRAKSGAVTIYQDESKIAAYQNDPSYLYLPLSAFSYSYRDAIVSAYAGSLSFKNVTLYEGVTADLLCSVECSLDRDITVGAYPMTLLSYEGEVIESLSFDESVRLVVTKRNIGEYGETDRAEIGISNSFAKRITLLFEEAQYEFELTADLTGKVVGDEVAYSSCVALTDDNYEITFGDARVTVGKRSTGVSLVAPAEKTVLYGDECLLCLPYLQYGEEDEQILEETISYRYRVGEEAYRNGLPKAVGTYEVSCSLLSELYEASPVSVSLTIGKRAVAAYYELSSSRKKYGQTFSFGSKDLALKKLYDCDRETLAVTGEGVNVPEGEFSGVYLRSTGAAASATVGEYDFDFSGIVSQNYDVIKAIVYDKALRATVDSFAVVKAAQAAPPEVECSAKTGDRKITVTAVGALEGQLSEKSDYSSPKEDAGTGILNFTKLTCGRVYYLRVRVIDGQNYESAEGEWRETTVTLPFPKPTVGVSSVTSSSAHFTVDKLKNSAEGYVIRSRVGSGSWKEGTEITGLQPNTVYTISFRAEKSGVVGESAEVTVRTLRAALPEEDFSCRFNKETGVLTVVTETEGTEYRLLSSAGEVLSDWSDSPAFDELQAETQYRLQIRLAREDGQGASDVTEIVIDTHEPEPPLTFKRVLADWFLLIAGGAGVLLLAIVVPVFIKKKNKILKGSGGKKK